LPCRSVMVSVCPVRITYDQAARAGTTVFMRSPSR
jgi:hypothetical protein